MSLKHIVLFTFAVCAAGLSAAQDVAVKTVPVKGNLYMLEGRGGNIGVSVGEDGVLIIDDQFENMAPPIRAAIEKLSKGKLKFVLNTHFHGDHTGGNVVFGQEAPIIAHSNVRTRLAKGKDLSDSSVRNGLPMVTFDDSLSIHFNGEEIRMVHFPTGHTDTDSIVFFTESNVVHMGDHFFSGFFPFIDLAGGGDVEQFLVNVHKVIGMIDDETKVIPGHGPLSTKKDLIAFAKTIEDTVGIVKKGIDSGKSSADLRKAGLPSKYDSWGTGFISEGRWVGIIYQSLTR